MLTSKTRQLNDVGKKFAFQIFSNPHYLKGKGEQIISSLCFPIYGLKNILICILLLCVLYWSFYLFVLLLLLLLLLLCFRRLSMREKCPYSELFWSVFSRIRTEYGEIRSISPYPIRMRENTNQKNSE